MWQRRKHLVLYMFTICQSTCCTCVYVYVIFIYIKSAEIKQDDALASIFQLYTVNEYPLVCLVPPFTFLEILLFKMPPPPHIYCWSVVLCSLSSRNPQGAVWRKYMLHKFHSCVSLMPLIGEILFILKKFCHLHKHFILYLSIKCSIYLSTSPN